MRLRELRLSKSLFQKDLAEHLGIDRTTYVKYENGSSEPPLESLVSLAKFYSVTLDYLVGISDQPSPEMKDSSCNELEQRLISDFRSLNTQGKEYVLQTMAMAVAIYKNDTVPNMENRA